MSLSEAITQHTLNNGGLLHLSWAELDEVDREFSLYQGLTAPEELSFIAISWHDPAEGKVGLLIEIPPVSQELAAKAILWLESVLTQKDYETIYWDVCHPNGLLLW